MESLILLSIASFILIYLTSKFFKRGDLWHAWLGFGASLVSLAMFGINLWTYIKFDIVL